MISFHKRFEIACPPPPPRSLRHYRDRTGDIVRSRWLLRVADNALYDGPCQWANRTCKQIMLTSAERRETFGSVSRRLLKLFVRHRVRKTRVLNACTFRLLSSTSVCAPSLCRRFSDTCLSSPATFPRIRRYCTFIRSRSRQRPTPPFTAGPLCSPKTVRSEFYSSLLTSTR